MHKVRRNKIVFLLLSSLICLCLAGCGNNQSTDINDYGPGTGAETDSENDSDTGVSTNENLSDMLGGTELSYNNSFSLGSKQISVNVSYNIEGTESLSEYLVEAVSEDQIDEQHIVESFFGDTAIPFNAGDTLDQENGDSIYPIMASQMIAFNNTNSGNDVTAWTSKGDAWVDEGNYYIHTYNGTYRNTDYQLLVSYSNNTNDLVVVLFPINIGELSGNPSCESMDFSGPDGQYSSYYKNKMKVYNIDEVLAPNKCSLSDDQVITTASSSIKDAIGIEYPDESLSMNTGLTNYIISEDPHNSEILYYPESALGTDNFEGAERNGYAVSVLGSLDSLDVMTNTSNTSYSATMFNNGVVGIDNEGIVALYITTKYTFKEKTVDNVKVLGFKESMDKFVEEAPDNLDQTLENKIGDNASFDVIQLVYYPVSKEGSTNEYRLVPAWSLDALDSDNETVARILINAEDGSYITTLYKPE